MYVCVRESEREGGREREEREKKRTREPVTSSKKKKLRILRLLPLTFNSLHSFNFVHSSYAKETFFPFRRKIKDSMERVDTPRFLKSFFFLFYLKISDLLESLIIIIYTKNLPSLST